MKRIYLDYAASTPVDPAVFEFMRPYFSEKYGNAGSLHSFGQEAIAAVDVSRGALAKTINADFREIIFTGSATEANNLALRGAIKGFTLQALGVRNESSITSSLMPKAYGPTPRIIVSAIEHESVLETAKDLERDGIEVVYLSVDKNGFVDLKHLHESLDEKTVLVSVMYVNNEIGTIQSISAIGEVIRKWKLENRNKLPITNYQFPLLHSDAVQAFQFLDCDVKHLGVDLMTLSAHKIYGPKGIGALFVRSLNPNGYTLKPIVTGGGQAYGLRSGTENTPLIAGFGKAAELVSYSRELENKRIGELKKFFWEGLQKAYPSARMNVDFTQTYAEKNSAMSASVPRNSAMLPSILNVYFPNNLASDLLIKLDMAGIAVSSGAACSVRSSKPSHVLKALGLPTERILRSIRFSFGAPTTKEEIKEALARIEKFL